MPSPSVLPDQESPGPDLDLARTLFVALHQIGFDGRGITRASYGDGENRAHLLFAETARQLGLEVRRDWAANLYMTMPGQDRTAPVVMTGSHLDSVPVGGNFDGAAGVVAGLSVLAGWCRAGYRPACDVTVMAIRAEESAWFPVSYIGSKAAFCLLTPADLAVVRRDTGRSLADHMAQAGGDPSAHAAGGLDAGRIACFIELHIEQGPVLIQTGTVVGIVSGICGSLRYRNVHVRGTYAHSGATPRAFRRDAVMGAVALTRRLHERWLEHESQGDEMTLTFGVFRTDPDQADFSTIAGDVELSIDVRSRDPQLLRQMGDEIEQVARAVEAQEGVSIDLGPRTGSTPARMDEGMCTALLDTLAPAMGLSATAMPSGAGHDTALFANQGIPTAMIFVRNANGSHNPDEAMEFDDFAAATTLLGRLLHRQAGLDGRPRCVPSH
ncbi:Zn-dependent hydrolase [Komagataeibacter melomenusus]